MDPNGVFQEDLEMMSGKYSFKSLLLDGEGMDDEVEMVEGGTDQLILSGDLAGLEETLYRDQLSIGARESFKSLLLDGESLPGDKMHLYPTEHNPKAESNGNHVNPSALPETTAEAPQTVALGQEEMESFTSDTHQGSNSIGPQALGFVKERQELESSLLGRKRRRCDSPNSAFFCLSNTSDLTTALVTGLVGNSVESFPELTLNPKQPQLLSSQAPPSQPLQSPVPTPKKKQQQEQQGRDNENANSKKKEPVVSSDVQKLLDSVIARQEMFFADLLESMERKEAIRERMREAREEKWRAEERAQLGVFNNAMLALTQELLADAKSGQQLMDEAK